MLAGAWSTLGGVSLGALAVAIGLHVWKLAAEARAWHEIVRHGHEGGHVRFATTFAAFVGSIGANAILPARVGEAFRIGTVTRRVPGTSALTVTATIVLETALEIAFSVAVVAAVVLTGRSFGPAGMPAPLHALAAHPAALAGLGILLGIAVVAAHRLRDRLRGVAARLAAGFAIVRAPRAFVTRVLSWKLLAWTLRLASVYAFLLAFHVPAAPWTAVVVVAAQSVAASVPLIPGNAGTQQAVIGIALAGSASAASVLGFGVGMQAATTIADLVLGGAAVLLLTGRRRTRSGRRIAVDRPAGALAP